MAARGTTNCLSAFHTHGLQHSLGGGSLFVRLLQASARVHQSGVNTLCARALSTAGKGAGCLVALLSGGDDGAVAVTVWRVLAAGHPALYGRDDTISEPTTHEGGPVHVQCLTRYCFCIVFAVMFVVLAGTWSTTRTARPSRSASYPHEC